MGDVAASLISAGSALIGAAIGAEAALWSTRAERRDRAAAEVTAAYVEFLSCCDQVANQLGQLPLRNEREFQAEQPVPMQRHACPGSFARYSALISQT
jgi:hypothetical protein